MKPTWQRISEVLVLRTPIMDLVKRRYQLPDESKQLDHDFYVIRSRDWCNVIPVTAQGTVILVRQFRVGVDSESLEVPGGIKDDSDATPEATGLRELVEETGYELAPGGRCENILSIHPNPAILDNRCHLFLAGPVALTRAQSLDPSERVSVVEVPIDAVSDLLLRGEISHTLNISAFGLLLLKNPGRTLSEVLWKFSRSL